MRSFRITAVTIAAWLLLAAESGFAQAPRPALNVPNTEIFGGFLVTSPDYGPSLFYFPLYGGEVAISKGMTRHFAAVATVDFVSGSFRDVKQLSATVGGKYSFTTGKYRPYFTSQIGFAYQRSHGFYAGDHHPPLAPGALDIEDGLTYRIGGGLDVQVTPHISWRVGQWDWQPQPWARHTPFYQNFSSGLGWDF